MATSTILLGWLLTMGPAATAPAEPELLPAPRLIDPELLPMPQKVPQERILIEVVPVDPFYMPDPYVRMRLYARDRYGYLRPRVIYGPYGAYYPATGEPYPFTPVKGIQ